MNKNQKHKHINNVNNYNNNNNYYYNNNYYSNGYNYKKQYSKNNNNNMNNNMNNYNEGKKNNNNYYNNNYNDNHNDYYDSIYNQSTRKRKNYRYNNNNYYENNNYNENNNEEMISKSINENKDKIELIKIQINLRNNQFKELIVYKDDDINLLVKQFCSDNGINENLIEPLIHKIKQSLIKLNIVNNYVQLNRDEIVMLEKAKKILKNK